LKKNYKFGSEKTYFSCLNIYESNTPYDADQEIDNTSYSHFARKPGSQLLTRYKIVKILQENTFGFIYLVEKLNKNTKYIIKEFFPHEYVTRNDKDEMILNTPLDIESLIRFNYMQKFFMGEANNLEKISIKPHTNIIKIASVEKNKNNTSYIIYPYEEGMTLQRYMEIKSRMGKAQLDRTEVDKILKPLLQAVEHLHTLNIYHLNIKPENILIKKDGSLLLLGFEASTFFNDEDSRVFCNAYTPQYTAPEQIKNNNFSDIGKQSDIYAIGVLLYRLVTSNCPPSAQERMACKQKDIAYDPYIPIEEKKELLEKYDLAFLWVIDKSMMLTPKERFKDIASLRKSLYLTPVTKRENFIENKRNFLLYALLLIASIYIIFEGLSKIGNDDELAVTTVSKKVLKSEENISILEVENESKKVKEEKYVELNEAVKIKDINSDENISEKQEVIDNDVMGLSTEKEERLVQEEQRIVKEKEIDENSLNKPEITQKHEIVLNIKEEEVPVQEEIKTVPIHTHEMQIDKNETMLINLMKKNEIVAQEVNTSIILETKKSIKETLKPRKKKVIRKTKTISKKRIIKKRIIKKRIKKKRIITKRIKKKTNTQPKKTSTKRSSTHVWYCKAIGGNIRSSARHPDKARAKNIALRQCRNKAGSQKHCRILHCILI